MKNTRRTLTCAAALLLLAQLAACASDGENGGTVDTKTDDAGTTAAVTTEAVDPKIQQKADYYASITAELPSANGETKEIHFISDTGDISVEAEDGEKLNDAMYRRNIEIEEKLGYKVVNYEVEESEILSKIKNSVNAGDGAYDAISMRTYMIGGLFSGGYLQDMNDLENVNYYEPWWNQSANANLTFGGVRYCGLSSLCHRADSVCEMVLINKKMAENLDLEVPYQAAYDGKWTYDMLHEMMKMVPTDSNGDGQMDYNDVVGLVGQSQDITASVIACGMTYFVKDENDMPVFTLDKEENANKFEKIYDLFTDDTYAVIVGLCQGINDDPWGYWGTKFLNGESLFMLEFPANLSGYTDMEDDYGVLPMPKYDESQAEYRTMTNLWHTSALCIPKVHAATEGEIGLVLDAMSFLSYVDVEPTYAETYLENRYIRDEESVDMMNIVIRSMYYDPAFALYESWSYPLGIPMEIAASGNNNFASTVASKKKGIEKAVESTKKVLEDY